MLLRSELHPGELFYTLISRIDVPRADSILDIVSNERFSLPLSILEIYCWLQPAFSANSFCVIPLDSISSRILIAIA